MILHDDHQDTINRTAGGLARRYPEIGFEEIRQELYLAWYGKLQRYLPGYLDDEDAGERKLRAALRNAATLFCVTERATRSGYEADDLAWYSKGQLEALIPVALDPLGLLPQGQRFDSPGRSNADPAESGNLTAMVLDVRAALARLPVDSRELVALAVREDSDWERVARALGCTADAARMRYGRVVAQLQRKLGGARPMGVSGGRRAQSNSAAQALTSSDYGGE